MKLKSISLSLFISLFLFISCSDSDRDEDSTTVATIENAMAENLINDVWKEVHSLILSDTVLNPQDTTLPNEACIDSVKGIPAVSTYPVNVTIYYGSDETQCLDGRLRNGKVMFSLSEQYTDSGSVLTINFDNYWLDEYRLTGAVQIENLGSSSGLPKFRKTVVDGRIWKDGFGNNFTDIMYNANQDVVWGIGANTDTVPSDDELRISGTTNGRNSRGKYFTTSITDELISRTDCNWETAGEYKLKLGTLADRFVNIGDGTCDNKVIIRINGSSQEVRY